MSDLRGHTSLSYLQHQGQCECFVAGVHLHDVSLSEKQFVQKIRARFFTLHLIRRHSHPAHHVEDVRGLSKAFNAVGVGQALHNAVCLVACWL